MLEPVATLTYEQTKADLLELAASNPERTIDDMGSVCVYFAKQGIGTGPNSDLAPGQGCCIVGRVLEKHGVTLEDMGSLNVGATVGDLRAEGLIKVDDDTFALLWEAQSLQDSGARWQEAVERAIYEAEHNVWA